MIKKEKCLAIITARGGSKRIPRKNIKNFNGKPIIAYSIEAALKSGIFDEVMVSTEDVEIADISKSYGASIPFYRSMHTANDFASTADVLYEVLTEYEKRGVKFDKLCCIYPTAPFVTKEKIRRGYDLLEDGIDEVLPVVSFSFPPQRCVLINDNRVKMKWPEHIVTRSQDLEKWFHDCGQFYFLNVESFMKQKSIVMKNTVPMIINELEVQDIDNEDDWNIAEIKYNKMIEKYKDD